MPIRRKNHCPPTGPLHGKRGNKNQQLRPSPNRRSDDIIIPQEPGRVPPTDPELHEEADEKVHHGGAVDADGEVTEIPAQDRGEEVVEADVR